MLEKKEAKVRTLDLNNSAKPRRYLYSTIIEAADLFLGKLSYRYENGRFLRDNQLLKIIYLNR